jgi:hypothetical protein
LVAPLAFRLFEHAPADFGNGQRRDEEVFIDLFVSGGATTRALAAGLAAIDAAIKLRGELWTAQPKPTAGVRRASGRANH